MMQAPTRWTALAAALAVAAVATPAVADDVVVYQAEGSASAALDDARTPALDVAFAAAVTEAVADLAGAGARAQADAIEREIIRRARRFVAAFSVTDQHNTGDELVLEVAVKIDRDKLRARLGELGVTLAAVATTPAPLRVARRRATVLLRVTGLGRPLSTFGAAATDDVPGREAIGLTLDRAGFAVVSASAAGPAPPDAAGLPVDDAGARALAGDARADVAVVVGIAVGELVRSAGSRPGPHPPPRPSASSTSRPAPRSPRPPWPPARSAGPIASACRWSPPRRRLARSSRPGRASGRRGRRRLSTPRRSPRPTAPRCGSAAWPHGRWSPRCEPGWRRRPAIPRSRSPASPAARSRSRSTA